MKITIGRNFHDAAIFHKNCAALYKSQIDVLTSKIASTTDAIQKSASEAHLDFCRAMQELHSDEAERCEGCAISIEQGLEDSGGDSDLPTGSSDLLDACLGSDERFRKQLQPDRVHNVVPEVPARAYLVPRHGSAPIEQAATATLNGVDFLDLKGLEN